MQFRMKEVSRRQASPPHRFAYEEAVVARASARAVRLPIPAAAGTISPTAPRMEVCCRLDRCGAASGAGVCC